jgi:hypothetical protein
MPQTTTAGGHRSAKIGANRKTQKDATGTTPEASDAECEFLCQQEAAKLLKVCARYLRESSCPKRLLPGNGPQGKHVVRYIRSEVLRWAGNSHGRS